ncbi:unnamed protein product [Linum trigynum]|uniref:Uncharacterized protein n=1 Tax=Linum trigynum TaxID=586398 RepID=A0AAV2CLY6_9ROSI
MHWDHLQQTLEIPDSLALRGMCRRRRYPSTIASLEPDRDFIASLWLATVAAALHAYRPPDPSFVAITLCSPSFSPSFSLPLSFFFPNSPTIPLSSSSLRRERSTMSNCPPNLLTPRSNTFKRSLSAHKLWFVACYIPRSCSIDPWSS